MAFTPAKIKQILTLKCPRCYKGNLFLSHPYNFKMIGEMHKNCTECGQSFTKEPGFYFGAAYASYGVAVLIGVLAWIPLWLLEVDSIAINLGTICGSVFVLGPYNFCLSRTMWLSLFVDKKE